MKKKSSTASQDFVTKLLGKEKLPTVSKDKYLYRNEDFRFAAARVLLCGLLKNQFYRSSDEASKEALPIILEAVHRDPLYMLKAAKLARNSNMKGMVLTTLAAISTTAPDIFLVKNRSAIVSILKTFAPNQLLQFVEILKSKKLGKGFGARPQKWVAEVMQGWNPEVLEKYTMQYRSTINSLLRLVHPVIEADKEHLLAYPLDKEPMGKRQIALNELKGGTQSPKKVAKTILDYNLPWDAVKGFYGDYNKGLVALSVISQMGLSALLLNIESFNRNGVFDNKDGLTVLTLKLDEVRKGRALPIDFAKPYLMTSNSKVKSIIEDTLAKTLEHTMPEIGNRRIGLSIDISGSMSGENLQTAGMCAIPFLNAKNLWFSLFDTQVYEEGMNHGGGYGSRGTCPILHGKEKAQQVKSLLNLTTAGGTNVSSPIDKATSLNKKLDLMIIITDEQQNVGVPIMKSWEKYKKQVNPRAELWIINVASYDFHCVHLDDPSIVVYQTMNPAIFKNLEFAGQDLVSAIESVSL